MASKLDIGNAILRAYAYALELTEQLADEHDKGCYDCFDASSIECLLWTAETLQDRSDRDILDEDTDKLYEQLVEATSPYYGDAELDPNASIPYNTVVIDGNEINTRLFNQDDLISDGIGTFYLPITLLSGEIPFIINIKYTSGLQQTMSPMMDFSNGALLGFVSNSSQVIKVSTTLT